MHVMKIHQLQLQGTWDWPTQLFTFSEVFVIVIFLQLDMQPNVEYISSSSFHITTNKTDLSNRKDVLCH